MTSLIACLSTGKGTWANLYKLVDNFEWDNVFLITNSFGKENFKPKKNVGFIIVDANRQINEIADDIKKAVSGRIIGTEVALNIISGTGKEHTAIISGIINSGLGFRLVDIVDDKLVEV